ncbi:MAG: ABC transporter ATP-binding protein [Casimicrobiaceae bacterium]|nr:ABC transporter ATP-binding protein [Casimicrobiaceae bacterium]MDW8312339.1 ABC transporter ATP-binding protein [Burkholderiales bacterium]
MTTATVEPTLLIEDLTVALPPGADRTFAVEGVRFDVRAGEIVCLLGESGSGKSMIAYAITGLLPEGVKAVGGRILLGTENLLALDAEALRERRGRDITMIFQEPMTALNPVMTCGAQVDELLAAHSRLDATARKARTLELFERVRLPEPERIYASYPHQLSGGQRQRIMIAMALALQPKLVIADEPTTALDVTTQAEVLALIRALQREHGTAVLFITHDMGVVAEIADRVVVLERGRIVEAGDKAQVLQHPREPYTRMLIAAVPSMDPPDRPARARGEPVLRVEKLGKVYVSGGWLRKKRVTDAARNVTFELRRGETLGIVGESGSGKSTVARAITRLIEPSAGAIWLGNERLDGGDRAQLRRLRKRIQIVFQDPYRSLDPRQRVGEAIIEGPMNFGVSRREAWARAERLMELVRLDPAALMRYPNQFSGGQRQRLSIARALALEPEVLICDEAVSALDVSVQAQVLELLSDIQRRLDLAILFITHDLRVAAQICDRLLVMSRGDVVEAGRTAEVFRNPKHPYTRQLLASAPGRDFTFARVERPASVTVGT